MITAVPAVIEWWLYVVATVWLVAVAVWEPFKLNATTAQNDNKLNGYQNIVPDQELLKVSSALLHLDYITICARPHNENLHDNAKQEDDAA